MSKRARISTVRSVYDAVSFSMYRLVYTGNSMTLETDCDVNKHSNTIYPKERMPSPSGRSRSTYSPPEAPPG